MTEAPVRVSMFVSSLLRDTLGSTVGENWTHGYHQLVSRSTSYPYV